MPVCLCKHRHNVPHNTEEQVILPREGLWNSLTDLLWDYYLNVLAYCGHDIHAKYTWTNEARILKCHSNLLRSPLFLMLLTDKDVNTANFLRSNSWYCITWLHIFNCECMSVLLVNITGQAQPYSSTSTPRQPMTSNWFKIRKRMGMDDQTAPTPQLVVRLWVTWSSTKKACSIIPWVKVLRSEVIFTL